MAFMVNRYPRLLLLFLGALFSYFIGFTVGIWLLIAIGVFFELTFWFELLFRKSHSRKHEKVVLSGR